MDVRLDVTYGSSWPSQAKRPIFKVKRFSEKLNPPFYRFSCAIFRGFFGYPKFGPHFCKNFTWTSAKTLPMGPVCPYGENDSFWVKTTPGAGKPPILPFFMCYSSPSFLVIWNSDFIFAKILPGRPLRPFLWSQLALKVKTAHFQGQTISGSGKPHILPIFVCYSQWICWWSGFRPHFCQNFTWTSYKIFPIDPVGLQGQNDLFSMSNEPRSR